MTGPLRLREQALSVKLPPGRALTLRVQRAGLLRLRGLRVWLTLTSSGRATPPWGDCFLDDGQAWDVAVGQSWVVEPFAAAPARANAARLDWQPAPSWTGQWQAALSQLMHRADRHRPGALPSWPGAGL